jgi:hypothetical protein
MDFYTNAFRNIGRVDYPELIHSFIHQWLYSCLLGLSIFFSFVILIIYNDTTNSILLAAKLESFLQINSVCYR